MTRWEEEKSLKYGITLKKLHIEIFKLKENRKKDKERAIMK